MRKIVWTAPARNDLIGIEKWLDEEAGSAVAVRVLSAIKFRCQFLQDFPHGGPPVGNNLRKLRIHDTPYLIVYRIQKSGIDVVRVFHERQDWQSEI
jgi:toxin ParE1/3/4